MDALKMLRGGIDGVTPEVVAEIIEPLTQEQLEQPIPNLVAIYKVAKTQKLAFKSLEEVRARAAKYPKDKNCSRMLADVYATVGKWKLALKEYVKCGGVDAKAAADEEVGKKLAAGNYWWDYVPTTKDDASIFKLHAVSLYRAGLADGSIDALAKKLVEGRIKELADLERAAEIINSQSKTDGSGHRLQEAKTITLPGGAKLEMVWCPACPDGFMMGSPEGEKNRGNNETQHRVKLTRGFWIGKYEVTQDQWWSVMGYNPSQFKGGSRPVDRVSWDACQKFCQKAGQGLRLPTEAEWEYACRAGTTGDYSGNLFDMAWFNRNSSMRPHSVGGKAPNAWGIYDMHGNSWEWCQDWLGDYPSVNVTDPMGPDAGEVRVVRGGCWGTGWAGNRTACRSAANPTTNSSTRGFRVVCFDAPAESKSKQ